MVISVNYSVNKDRSISVESGTEEKATLLSGEGDQENISRTAKTFVLENSNSVLGEEKEVRSFLTSSAEAVILAMGKDGQGITLLTMVADCQACMNTVTSILINKAMCTWLLGVATRSRRLAQRTESKESLQVN